MLIFIDTSIFIRYFTQDDLVRFADSKELFEAVERGFLLPYTSNIVILELNYVLTKIYKFRKQIVIPCIEKVLLLRNITLLEETNTKQAIIYFQHGKIKYADCLIATQIPENVTLVTYDSEFKRIPRLTIATPGEILKQSSLTS